METETNLESQPEGRDCDGQNELKVDCPDGESSEVSSSSLKKDDSGITLEASLSSKSENFDDDASCSISSPPVVCSQDDVVQDVEMSSNDNELLESLNDSAVPSPSSMSDSSADMKSNKDEGQGREECSLFHDSDLDGEAACGSGKKSEACTNGKESTTDKSNENRNENGRSEEGVVELDVDNTGTAIEEENSLSSLTSSDEEEGNENSNRQGQAVSRYLSQRLFRTRNRRNRRLRHGAAGDGSSSDSSLGELDNEEDNNDAIGANDDENDEDENDDDNEEEDDVLSTDSAPDFGDKVNHADTLKTASEILNKRPPPPNWFAVQEIHKREYGCTSRQSLSAFNEKVRGSMYMTRRLKMVDSMKYHEGCVNSLCFNRIGTLLASGSDDLNIVLWNWQCGRPSLVYGSGHRSNVFEAKFMPYSGDCHIVSCARDGQVRLAELSLTGVCKNTRKLAQHKGAAHKLALEYDTPNIFLSCGEDAVTYMFDLRDDRPHRLVTTKESDKKVPLYSIHSNPSDPRQFCVGGRDHFIRVYDKRKISEDVDGGVLKKLCPDHLVDSPNKANVTCACYNYNGSEILGSYNDEDVYLFDNTYSDGCNYSHRYRGHRNNETVKGVNFYGPRSEFIISGSDCGNMYIWEKQTEAVITFLEGDKAGVINKLEPHPTLPVLATSGLDHDVKLWTPSDPNPVLDTTRLKKTVQRNIHERRIDMTAEPTVMSGQMLWMLMHHFRNTARRRLREEGQELSTSDEDEEENESDDSETTTEINQCAQS